LQNVDVAVQPLFRVRLYKLSPLRWVLWIEAHHVVVDGSSWCLLFAELAWAYERELGQQSAAAVSSTSGSATGGVGVGAGVGAVDRTTSPPLPPGSFAEWSTAQLQSLTQPESKAAMQQIVEVLRGYEDRGTTLPTTHPRDLSVGWHLRTDAQREIEFKAPAASLAKLRSMAEQCGCTYFAAMVAVFHAWQYSISGKLKVALMASTTWRDHRAEGLIGCFVTDLVLVADLAADGGGSEEGVDAPAALCCTFTELMRRVMRCHAGMTRHTAAAPLATWNAVFDSPPLPYVLLLNWVPKMWDGELELAGLDLEDISPPDPDETPCAAESELDIEFDEGEGEFIWRYNTSLYSDAAIAEMTDAFLLVLDACSAAPHEPLPPSSRSNDVFGEWLSSTLPAAASTDAAIDRWQAALLAELHAPPSTEV
jgi:hypothetical protein